MPSVKVALAFGKYPQLKKLSTPVAFSQLPVFVLHLVGQPAVHNIAQSLTISFSRTDEACIGRLCDRIGLLHKPDVLTPANPSASVRPAISSGQTLELSIDDVLLHLAVE